MATEISHMKKLKEINITLIFDDTDLNNEFKTLFENLSQLNKLN